MSDAPDSKPPEPRRTGGDDAVCFTTGRVGAMFSAGVIHAWLAADRKKPEIVAGISMGAVSAAALQRVYEEIEDASVDPAGLEAVRWRWFRRYFDLMRRDPWRALWRSLPSPLSFFADLKPVSDPSVPEALRQDELEARATRYRLVKLGRWLGGLPIRVSEVARILVRFVRLREGYAPLGTRALLVANGLSVAARLYLHVMFHPHFTRHETLAPPHQSWWQRMLRRLAAFFRFSPLMGWRAYGRLVMPHLIWLPVLGLTVILFQGQGTLWQRVGAGVPVAFGLLVVITALWYLVINGRLRPRNAAPLRALTRALGIEPAAHFRPGWTRVTPAFIRRFADMSRLSSLQRLSGFAPVAGWRTFLRAWRRPALRLTAVVAVVAAVTASAVAAGLVGPTRELLANLATAPADWIESFLVANPYWTLAGVLTVQALLSSGAGLVQLGRPSFRREVLHGLGIEHGLAHPYEIRRQLLELFQRDDPAGGSPRPPTISGDVVKLLTVAAPLQRLSSQTDQIHSNQQLWARNGAPLITALEAAIALPGVLRPVRAVRLRGAWERNADINDWYEPRRGSSNDPGAARDFDELDLVDGAVIRTNPLPALFAYLHCEENRPTAETLERTSQGATCGVHVVYNVPLRASPREPGRESFDVVEAARRGLRLAQRRDTKLEARQSNFISSLQATVDKVAQRAGLDNKERPAFRIFVDAIAPEDPLVIDNPFAPRPQEVCETAARGCRATLESMYGDRIREIALRPGRPKAKAPAANTEGDPTAAPKKASNAVGFIQCHELLGEIAPRRASAIQPTCPGLDDICSHCPKELRVTDPGHPASSHPKEMTRWPWLRDTKDQAANRHEVPARLATEFPHLATPPRIVFVASGGVFRGAFHIGMLAGLHAAGIRPDLVVGSSVGAVLGAALAGMTVADYSTGCGLVQRMAALFFLVDQRVSLTRTLKSAAKQMGVRGRQIHLSPESLRQLVQDGSRADAGFAATGAPPQLIDAISDLFALPHRQTRRIAALMVSGDLSQAANRFLHQLQVRTLSRLEVREAVMGTALLEPAIRDVLLGIRIEDAGRRRPLDFTRLQPFNIDSERRVAFFATTTNLNERHSMLLGRDFLYEQLREPIPYDFIESVLCSSAFPLIFAPRRESSLLPGFGNRNTFFSDGGMFDNLPFFPAMEVLADVQVATIGDSSARAAEHVHRTIETPDLFLVGALDLDADDDADAAYGDDVVTISRRAATLKNNVKISAFQQAAALVDRQMHRLSEALKRPQSGDLDDDERASVAKIVNAGVLKVAPSDKEHLNGTFAFSRAVGLDREVVARSIANGCFRSMLTVANVQRDSDSDELAPRAMRALLERPSGAPARVEIAGMSAPNSAARLNAVIEHRTVAERRCQCPWFHREDPNSGEMASFGCPFTHRADIPAMESKLAEGIYRTCFDDRVHFEETRSQLVPTPTDRLAARLKTRWQNWVASFAE